MSCLIYTANSDGCTGRCDANCYNATGPVCKCVCGGKNHGVGETQARQNTAEMGEKMIDNYIKVNGGNKKDFVINPDIFQLKLF